MNARGKAAAGLTGELTALLHDLGTVPPDAGMERGRALVRTLGQPAEMLSLIGSVLADPPLLRKIASRSYPHVNNFDKIVLIGAEHPDAYRLTVHLWRPPYPLGGRGEEMIHGHRFSFWSAVVTGTLSSEMFEESERGRPLRKYRYLPEANRAAEFEDFYQYEASVSLARIGTSEKRAGESYYLDASAIHRVILPHRATTCSLVLRGPRLSAHSCVYSSDYPRRSLYLRNRMFSPSELAARLRHLVSALTTG